MRTSARAGGVPKPGRGVVERLASLGAGVWTVPDVGRGIRYARKLHGQGGGAILNILGEHHATREAVEEDVGKYLELVDAIAAEKERTPGFRAAISIKPTQFGFAVHEK